MSLIKLKENASAYSRTFYNEVRRCEEMERSLRKFTTLSLVFSC